MGPVEIVGKGTHSGSRSRGLREGMGMREEGGEEVGGGGPVASHGATEWMVAPLTATGGSGDSIGHEPSLWRFWGGLTPYNIFYTYSLISCFFVIDVSQ